MDAPIDEEGLNVVDTIVSNEKSTEATIEDKELLDALRKRVTAKPKAYENEKYAFRCFLLRLGLIGDEYKTSRKILLKNLNGNSSWRDGHRREEVTNAVSEEG